MSGPKTVRVDLHNHTHYSRDSILSPAHFVREARRRGLDCVAVTDHNTIRGALALRESTDFPIIVGEEVRSADGEVLGLFLSEEVPKGLSGRETIERIKAQGALVGIPHPFDGQRLALRREHMEKLIGQIDFIEGFNSRMVFASGNDKAVEFARAHGVPVSAGSDAHSPLEVARAYVEMPAFESPADFMAALRQGRLGGRLSSPFVHLISRYARLRRLLGWKPPNSVSRAGHRQGREAGDP